MIHFKVPRNSISFLTRHQTGQSGEKLAVRFLEQKGFRPVQQNYRIRGGELDAVMENDDIILFVEVKTRTGDLFGDPEDALTPVQTRRLIRAALHWLGDNDTRKPWRCDLVAIRFITPLKAEIKHFENILQI